MANSRFVQRLHGTLRDWLTGLLNGTFEEPYTDDRREFGQKLLDIDLTFEEVVLVGRLMKRHLMDVAQEHWQEQPQALARMTIALDKALDIDTALICSSYLEVHDAEMEQVLLGRFLNITGFSRTLYESLAEARRSMQN